MGNDAFDIDDIIWEDGDIVPSCQILPKMLTFFGHIIVFWAFRVIPEFSHRAKIVLKLFRTSSGSFPPVNIICDSSSLSFSHNWLQYSLNHTVCVLCGVKITQRLSKINSFPTKWRVCSKKPHWFFVQGYLPMPMFQISRYQIFLFIDFPEGFLHCWQLYPDGL